MKFFATKFIASILFLNLVLHAKAANDTLTIRQAFDWKVGDTLIYQQFIWIYPSGPPYAPQYSYLSNEGFTVGARNNLGDTIVYEIRWLNSGADTLIFSQLDTSVAKFNYSTFYSHFFPGCQELYEMPTCDTPGIICVFNNFPPTPIDSFTSTDVRYDAFELAWSISFTENVGLRYADYGDAEFRSFLFPGGCGINLIYYHSDSLLWIDSSRYFYTSISEPSSSPSFRLYPNPATDEITITAETGNHVPYDVYVYDIAGRCLLSHKNILQNVWDMDVRLLPPGYYLLKLTDEDSFSSSKSFIVAH